MAELFGTDGIRGTANEYPITPEVAMKAGRAVARVLGAQKVVIGKDTRISGVMLENALSAGLISEGVEVLFTGAVPTPAVALLTKSQQADAGIMLTASHNPFADNGIKIFGPDGFKLSDAQEEAVEALILGEELVPQSQKLGKLDYISDASDQYAGFARQAVTDLDLTGVKIVLDCAHGAAFKLGPEIFRSLGAEVILLGGEPDGYNINEGVGSLYPEDTAKAVLAEGADIGVCFDGDADRVIFVDAAGQVLSGDRVLCLCAKALHSRGQLKNSTLVATVMSNLGLRDALSAEGIKLETTGVGDRLVLERMREGGFNLGGENSGHIIFSDYATTGDGIMSALMILSMMKESGENLAQLADCMEEYPQELVALAVKEKPALDSVPEIKKAMDTAEETLGETGRILVRYSGTEKKLRVLVEAKDAALAKAQCDAIVAAATQSIGA